MSKHSLFWRLYIPIVGIFSLFLVLVYIYIPSIIQTNAEQESIVAAKKTVLQFKTIRKYYTQNVVKKILGRDGLKGSVNHKNEKDSFPFPATMIHDLSTLMQEQGTSLKLYSPYPFPNRKARQLDKFGKEAWSALNKNSDTEFSQTEYTDDGTFVRVAIADKMVTAVCVTCHNSHPDTPKADWKLNDVRGVLEVVVNIDQQLANGNYISNTLIIIIFIMMLILSVVLVGIYKKSIGKRLGTISEAIGVIASGEGDLTKRLDDSGEDEVSIIARHFNAFAEKLELSIKEIVQSANALSITSEQLHQVTGTVTSNVMQQDGQTEEIAAAITQMSASAKEIAGHATETSQSTIETIGTTSDGQKIVGKSMQATSVLAVDVKKAADVLKRLQKDSDRIVGVLDVIKGIAEQTNLLALNAAIEAARAGEQGRGFAVVADEVHTLAARTQDSTTEIQEMTERLQSATEEAVSVMEKNQDQAEQSVELSKEVQQALEHITSSISAIKTMTDQVSTAASEQDTAVDTIHNNINDIVSLSSATAHGAEETNTHVNSLNDAVKRINRITDTFIVGD